MYGESIFGSGGSSFSEGNVSLLEELSENLLFTEINCLFCLYQFGSPTEHFFPDWKTEDTLVNTILFVETSIAQSLPFLLSHRCISVRFSDLRKMKCSMPSSLFPQSPFDFYSEGSVHFVIHLSKQVVHLKS